MLTRFSLFLLYFYGYFLGVKEHLRVWVYFCFFFLLLEHLDSVSLLPPRCFLSGLALLYYMINVEIERIGHYDKFFGGIRCFRDFVLHSFYFSGVAWSLVVIWLWCFETFQRTGAVKYKSYEVTNDMSKIGKEVFYDLDEIWGSYSR